MNASDQTTEPWPSDEALEAAAVSAETWHEHGNACCQFFGMNNDGFG